MKLMIEIPEDVYTRLFDNGIQDNEISVDDICEMARALRLGTPLSKFLEELKRIILMEVDGATGDRYLSYIDICDRISNSIDEYKAESEDKE